MMAEAIWHILLKLSPWLLLGTAVAAALHVTLPTGFARSRFTGVWGILRAVGFGVPLPLCSCGVVPAGIGLKQDGASDGAAIGFLISTPQTGVDSILVSASFLGWPFALLKVGAAAVTGILGGLLVETLDDQPIPPTASLQGGCGADGCCEPPGRITRAIAYGSMLLRSIWRWLVVGVLISAAITVLVPPAQMSWVREGGVLWASLVALVISLPLYVCATASVPIAAALVGSGFPVGAALVFLMAGPATNVATIGAVYQHFGRRALALYLATIIVGSTGFAVAFNSVIATGPISKMLTPHKHGAWWEIVASCAVLLLLVYYAWDDFWKWIAPEKATQPRVQNPTHPGTS